MPRNSSNEREGVEGGRGDEQRSRIDRSCPLRWERQVRSAWRKAEYIAGEETGAQRSR